MILDCPDEAVAAMAYIPLSDADVAAEGKQKAVQQRFCRRTQSLGSTRIATLKLGDHPGDLALYSLPMQPCFIQNTGAWCHAAKPQRRSSY
jgi:hypothetical protein